MTSDLDCVFDDPHSLHYLSCSASTCDSCPADRPVLLKDKRCGLACDAGEYFDSSSGSCAACDKTCKTCFNSGKDSCLSCDASSILQGGSCEQASCWGDAKPVTGYGVCLEDLVTVDPEKDSREASKDKKDGSNKSRNLLPIILGTLLGFAAFLLLAFMALRMYYKNRRREKTQQFQDKKELEQTPGGLMLWRHFKLFGKGNNNDNKSPSSSSPSSEFFPNQRGSVYTTHQNGISQSNLRSPSPAPSSRSGHRQSPLQRQNTGVS